MIKPTILISMVILCVIILTIQTSKIDGHLTKSALCNVRAYRKCHKKSKNFKKFEKCHHKKFTQCKKKLNFHYLRQPSLKPEVLPYPAVHPPWHPQQLPLIEPEIYHR
uniref:Cnidarian restricted protein n=1 Tax=Clytia hemisphaerica TaxID=252671 RepID=A0A7M5VC67_9CNID